MVVTVLSEDEGAHAVKDACENLGIKNMIINHRGASEEKLLNEIGLSTLRNGYYNLI